jgi:hypothetical protein
MTTVGVTSISDKEVSSVEKKGISFFYVDCFNQQKMFIQILNLVTNKEEKYIRNYSLIIDVMLKTFDKISQLMKDSAAASMDKELLYHLCQCESLGMPILTTWALRDHLDLSEDLFVRVLEFDCKGTIQVIENFQRPSISNKPNKPFIQIACGEIKADARGVLFIFLCSFCVRRT